MSKCCKIKIGDLRHIVSIEDNSSLSTDSDGYDTDGWAEISNGSVYAKIEPLRGGERWTADQRMPDISHRITIHHRTDVETDMRVTATLHGQSRTFKIEGIRRPDEEARYLELLCLELPAQ